MHVYIYTDIVGDVVLEACSSLACFGNHFPPRFDEKVPLHFARHKAFTCASVILRRQFG